MSQTDALLFWEAYRCLQLKQIQIAFLLEVRKTERKLPRNPILFSTRTKDSNCSGFMSGYYVNDTL